MSISTRDIIQCGFQLPDRTTCQETTTSSHVVVEGWQSQKYRYLCPKHRQDKK